MAIVKEETGKFIHTYSDANLMIKQVDTGILYVDAMDLKGYEHEYEETDEPIQSEEEPSEGEPSEGEPADDVSEIEVE